MATQTSMQFYLELPIREFIEINNEVAEEWEKVKT